MGHKIGMMSPITLFIPYSLFKHVWVRVCGYGGKINSEKDCTKVILRITQQKTAAEIWSTARFTGHNYLSLPECIPCHTQRILWTPAKASPLYDVAKGELVIHVFQANTVLLKRYPKFHNVLLPINIDSSDVSGAPSSQN